MGEGKANFGDLLQECDPEMLDRFVKSGIESVRFLQREDWCCKQHLAVAAAAVRANQDRADALCRLFRGGLADRHAFVLRAKDVIERFEEINAACAARFPHDTERVINA